MDDLKVRFKIKHNEDLISFETISDLPEEIKQSLKRTFCNWEVNTREMAVTNFIKELNESKKVAVTVREKSLSF